MPTTQQQSDLLQRSHEVAVQQVLDDNGRYFFDRRKAEQEAKTKERPESKPVNGK